MISDIMTIVWKEWKEIFLQRGSTRSGWFNLLIILGMLGVFLPYQTGREWLTNPLTTLVWSWMPVFLALNIVADAFAGERERHTLETLLASRLSDRAILLGKISAAVLYSWLIAMAGLVLGAITVNVAHPTGGLQFYSGWTFPLGMLLTLLTATLIASAGVLVSLNAPTARAAYQRLSVIVVFIWLLPSIGIQIIPDETRMRLLSGLQNANLASILAIALAVLLAADVILMLVAMARFRRARLILE